MNKVYIGSVNPVKIECTRKAFTGVFPEIDFDFSGIAVKSEVSEQPIGEKETLNGALNRVKELNRLFPEASFWIGIEGGIEIIEDDMYAFAWVVVKNRNKTGKAKTATFELPEPLKKRVVSGMELGDADDSFFNRSNSKYKDGTVGKLTQGRIDRIEFYKHALILALIPFTNAGLYA